jgi:hypothetical protein
MKEFFLFIEFMEVKNKVSIKYKKKSIFKLNG